MMDVFESNIVYLPNVHSPLLEPFFSPNLFGNKKQRQKKIDKNARPMCCCSGFFCSFALFHASVRHGTAHTCDVVEPTRMYPSIYSYKLILEKLFLLFCHAVHSHYNLLLSNVSGAFIWSIGLLSTHAYGFFFFCLLVCVVSRQHT